MLQRSGLWKGRISAYLPKDYIWLSEDKRSQCDLLRDYRRRLREAQDEELPSLIAEGRSLFRASGPFALSICISHHKRRRVCRATNARWQKRNPDVSRRILETADLGPLAVFVGMGLKALESGPLVKGLFYKCVCLDPLELEEAAPRWNETEKRVVSVSPETFCAHVTSSACVTAASVQGDTVAEGNICILDLESQYMRRDVLEMSCGRAVHSRQLRFI